MKKLLVLAAVIDALLLALPIALLLALAPAMAAHAGVFSLGMPANPAILNAAREKAKAASADAGSCYSVNDADARAYCIAKARREPSACYSIQNGAMRSQCLAEVR